MHIQSFRAHSIMWSKIDKLGSLARHVKQWNPPENWEVYIAPPHLPPSHYYSSYPRLTYAWVLAEISTIH